MLDLIFNVLLYRLFNEYEDYDYARTGSAASEKVLCPFEHDIYRVFFLINLIALFLNVVIQQKGPVWFYIICVIICMYLVVGCFIEV